MKIRNLTTWLIVVVLAVLLSGCLPCAVEPEDPVAEVDGLPPVPPKPTPPPPPPEPEPEVVDPWFDERENEDGEMETVVVDEAGNPISHVINFEFDQADLSSADFATLRRHAAALVANRSRSATIEGHCDERGTREYNLALGERRAQAVADYLMSAGVRESQITVVTFGEEIPLDAASTESAWAKNRRARIRIK